MDRGSRTTACHRHEKVLEEDPNWYEVKPCASFLGPAGLDG